MKALEGRASEIAAQARSKRARRLAEQLRTLLPDAQIEDRSGAIGLAAPGLRRRWLNDPALRFLARTGK